MSSDPARLDLYYSTFAFANSIGTLLGSVELLNVRNILEKEPVANYNFAMTLKSAGALMHLRDFGSLSLTDDGFARKFVCNCFDAFAWHRHYAEGWPLWESRWKDRHFLASKLMMVRRALVLVDADTVERLLVKAEHHCW